MGAFEELQARMHELDRTEPRRKNGRSRPGAWREETQTDEQAQESLKWCRRWLYELQFFGDGEFFAVLRVAVRQRIAALERRALNDEGLPF